MKDTQPAKGQIAGANFTATLTEYGDVRVRQAGQAEIAVYTRDLEGAVRVNRSAGATSCIGEVAAVAHLLAIRLNGQDYSDTPWLVIAPSGALGAAYPEQGAADVAASRLPGGYVVLQWSIDA